MITALSRDKIKQKFNLEFQNSPKLTQFGGSAVFVAFMRQVKIRQKLAAILGDSAAKAVCQLMLGIFSGAGSLRETAVVTKSLPFEAYLGSPYSETQLVRVLKKLSALQIHALHEFTLSQGLLDIIETVRNDEKIVLDVDATAVEKYGHQEGVEVGFVEHEKFCPCYQYLFFRADNPNTVLYGTIRGGAAHSQNGFIGYLKMILPCFGGIKPVHLRADAGYFNEEAFEIAGQTRTFLYIRAPMLPERRALAEAEHLEWVKDLEDENIEWSYYETCSKSGAVWREAFRRKKIKSDQNELLPAYETYCVATNNLWDSPKEIFEFYNGRAKVEQTIEEHKNDYNLGSIVTHSFDVNDVITQATFLLYQMVNHFKKHCLDKVDSRCRLSTLRSIIFNVPARVVSSGRRTMLRVHNVFRDALYYGRLLARLSGLRTLFVLAPAIDSS